MAGIYAADIYCDDCVDDIKADILAAGTVPADPDDECSYDSDEYPKYCDDSAEADCPQYCAECHVFLENDLTTDGYDYVAEMIENDLNDGCFDSVAVTKWSDFYGLGVIIKIDASVGECEKLSEELSDHDVDYEVCRA